MSIEIGHAYEFRFKTGFNSLNGIYRVTHAQSYASLLEEDIDLLTYLYSPAGKVQGDLDTDLADIVEDSYYKLVSVEDESVILYVPISYIVGVPVPDVREYGKVMVTVDLGVIADPALLASFQATLGQTLEEALGILTSPILMQYGTEWMSESAYQALEEAREAAKTGVTNYYTLSIEQAAEILAKDAKIAAYETLVADQHDLIP